MQTTTHTSMQTTTRRTDDGIRLVGLAPAGTVGSWRDLGAFPDQASALRALVEDTLAQLARADGWLVTTEHLIIGPGPDGTRTVRGHVTQLGADRGSTRAPEPYDEPAARRWLLAAHQLHD